MAKWVPLPPELIDQFKEADKKFRALFGRKPGKGDKLFFEQYLDQGDEFWSEVRQAGKTAGINDRLLYATQRTERFLTEENIALVSAPDLEEWDSACAEYDELKKLGLDPFNALDFDSPDKSEIFTELMHAIDEEIIGLGSVIDKNQPNGGRSLQSFLALYYAARAFHCIKLTKNILEDFPSRDAIGIVRTVYECTLRARFAISEKQAAETLVAQASLGSEHISQKVGTDGKIKRGWIVDKRSGEEFRAHTGFNEMAGSSGMNLDSAVHEELYPFLSGVAHADFADFHMYFSPEEGFFAQRHKGRNPETPLLVLAVSILLMVELSRVRGLTQRSRRDALFVARRHATLLDNLSARFPQLGIFAGMPHLKARLVCVRKRKLKQPSESDL